MEKSAVKHKQLTPFQRPLIKNAWYCAAWAEELGQSLLSRRIVDQPVLMYRAETGEPVALLDVCPHKLAPMHIGNRIGDNVQCGYHGLEFDKTGRCVRNPQGNGYIPKEARLRAFPVVERYGTIWTWMGDPARADDSKIPDYSHVDNPNRRILRGLHHIASNYMVMVENLMDLGHAMFLHGQTISVSEVPLSDNKFGQEGTCVFDLRLYQNVKCPSIFGDYVSKKGEPVDWWTDIRWNAPSLIRNDAGVSPVGDARGKSGIDAVGMHFLTPETQDTVHYFFAHSRNYGVDDPQIDQFFRNWQRKALKEEDGKVAEAIQKNLPEAERLGVNLISLSTDASGIRVNKILDELATAET